MGDIGDREWRHGRHARQGWQTQDTGMGDMDWRRVVLIVVVVTIVVLVVVVLIVVVLVLVVVGWS